MAIHRYGNNDSEFLRLNGLFIPVQVSEPSGSGRSDRGVAVIDFGASITFIRTTTALGLGLQNAGPLPVLTGAGQFNTFTYFVDLAFPTLEWEVTGHIVGSTGGLRSVLTDPPQPVLALIGRDLLEQCRFEWDGPKSTWALHYP